MNKKLDIERLKEEFGAKHLLSRPDIDAFYRAQEPSIPRTTVGWRIYALEQLDVLHRISRGKYSLDKTLYFAPQISRKMERIGQIINKQFPFARYCQWQLSSVNMFAQHLINLNVLLVDVERDAVEAVYYELKTRYSKVMLIRNLYDTLSEFDDAIIVRPLITDAPVQKSGKIYVPTLEKMLVDLCTDKEFISFQGNELYHIYERAFEAYTINEPMMLRYAGRKAKRAEVDKILKTINRQ